MKNLNQLVLVLLLFLGGCSPVQPVETEVAFPPTNDSENREAFEVFVFMSGAERDRVKVQLEAMVLRLPGGSLCHLIECPKHAVIGSVSVPYGPPKTRLKNRLFQNEYAAVFKYFNEHADKNDSSQLGVPVVAETVLNLRRTDMKCRVILAGTPIYDDAANPTFSMAAGMVPSDGLIGNTQSWVTNPRLPPEAKVSWLTAGNRWGSNLQQRQGIARFYRLYFKMIGGHLIRHTPDSFLAFSFSKPYLANDIVMRDEKAKMIDPKVETKLGPTDIQDEPVIVPVEKARVSFSKPGSFKYMLEMAGGNPDALAGDAVVLWLAYDGSGSMAANLANNNKTILKIAESLPSLVKSLEIGIGLHQHDGVEQFPITRIKDRKRDGGASYKKLESFLESIQAANGDPSMQSMLGLGMEQLTLNSADKRQLLMIVADHAEFQTDDSASPTTTSKQLAQEIKSWCNQANANRRTIAMYNGPSGAIEDFFQTIGNSNQHSFFTRQANDLIDDLLSAALPSKR